MVTVLPSSNFTDAAPGGLSGAFCASWAASPMAAIAIIKTTKPIRLFCIELSCDVRILLRWQRSLLFTFAADVTIRPMSVLDEKREELEHYEFRMGVPRGRLAVALDTL